MKTKRQIAKRAAPASPAAHAAKAVKRRILLVDDHPMTREGLQAVINREADIEVCAAAGSPADAMAALEKTKPDLMVTDLTMPGRSGTEFIKDVHAMRPAMPILVLSMHDEAIFAERVLRAGARGYVMKDAGSTRMLEAIRRVLGGQVYLSPQASSRLLESVVGGRPHVAESPMEKLSDREFEVFRLFGSGKTTKEIGTALGISAKTVAAHRSAIKVKLGVADGNGLVHYAVRWVESQATRV
jgi:DNA-binding NarL/FixJ family response regulator